MNWYYIRDGDKAGPVNDAVMSDLVRGGVVTGSTMVWTDGMAGWLAAELSPLQPMFGPAGSSPSAPPRPTDSAPSRDNDWERDPSKIYSSNPPMSPHLCWLSLLLVPGIAQMIFGQIGKGIVVFIAQYFLVFVTGPLAFLSMAAIIVDAFMVGKVLKAGKPVGKWQFFPQ